VCIVEMMMFGKDLVEYDYMIWNFQHISN
jgi:hypothetical protein